MIAGRIATSIRQLNPLDRRGIALVIATDCPAKDELVNELKDEAWQCIVTDSIENMPAALQNKVPDIIFAGSVVCNSLRQDTSATKSSHFSTAHAKRAKP